MRCLVTGVAGFIGSHLAERLLADGHEVCGIDAFVDYYPRQIKELNLEELRSSRRFRFIEGNLLDFDLLQLLEGVDQVFHQAAQAGVRASWGQEFSRYVDCNVLTTQRLLGEHLCRLYHDTFGVPTVSLRYFTVYRPRQRPDMAFHRFCKAIIQSQPLHIYGDGQQTRDFTYISDVVEANIQAAAVDGALGEVMNIAGGSRVTLQYVIDLLREITSAPVTTTFDDKHNGDVRHTFADTGHAEGLIGYHPVVSLREGLANEFEYIQSLASSRL